MKTEILKINSKKPQRKILETTVAAIKSGKIVVFPTETVYGIGAIFSNRTAIKKIYQLRLRPAQKALLILIASKKDLVKYVFLNLRAKKIIDRFWPGPLTIVLKKKKTVPDFVTANKKTVAVRIPENKFLLELIKEVGQPIVAPSANLSNQQSSVTAEKPIKIFKNKVDLILDAGQTKYQKESTIIDLSGKKPIVLRAGAISRKILERFIKLI